MALLLSAAALELVLVGAFAPAEARQYSAYADSAKSVISILSEERNVEGFQEEFGLSNGEIEDVHRVVRSENKALAREYSESQQVGASEVRERLGLHAIPLIHQ